MQKIDALYKTMRGPFSHVSSHSGVMNVQFLIFILVGVKSANSKQIKNGSEAQFGVFENDIPTSKVTKRDSIGQYGQISTPNLQRIPQSDLPFDPVDNSLVDFSQAVLDPTTGKLCVTRFESVNSLERDPILECDHKQLQSCHFTYVTQFQATQEEVCEENFEKVCQIVFRKQAFNETVRKCYTPVQLDCQDGQQPQQSSYGAPKRPSARTAQGSSNGGDVICRTVKETMCTTRYIKKKGKIVGDTSCKSIPVELCGASTCQTRSLSEECHDKVVASIVDIPEETCDLNPQEVCRLQTKLIPKLTPIEECKTHPREVCQMKFTPARNRKKPITIKYCLMSNAQRPSRPAVVSNSIPVFSQRPENSYGSPQRPNQPSVVSNTSPVFNQRPSNSYGSPQRPNPPSNSYGSPQRPNPPSNSYGSPQRPNPPSAVSNTIPVFSQAPPDSYGIPQSGPTQRAGDTFPTSSQPVPIQPGAIYYKPSTIL